MPTIQIGSYSFEISEPYQPGHPLSASEARALNSQRTERLRNLIYKKISTMPASEDGLLDNKDLVALSNEVRIMDRDFQFVSQFKVPREKGTVQAMIWEVACERAAERARSSGTLAEVDALEEEAKLLIDNIDVVEEGRRRFKARQEVTKAALAELLK